MIGIMVLQTIQCVIFGLDKAYLGPWGGIQILYNREAKNSKMWYIRDKPKTKEDI
jgi:hypothetical protein